MCLNLEAQKKGLFIQTENCYITKLISLMWEIQKEQLTQISSWTADTYRVLHPRN